jgi:DNA repair exonuclease SbcCD ATPase subunit
MDVCKNHRDAVEIVHDQAICPLCDAERQIDEWEREACDKNEKITRLEKEIYALVIRIDGHMDEISGLRNARYRLVSTVA